MTKKFVANRKQPTGSVVHSANGRAVPYVHSHEPGHLRRIMSADAIARSSAAVERVTAASRNAA